MMARPFKDDEVGGQSGGGKLPGVLKQFLLESALWTVICAVSELSCRLLHWGYPYDYPAVPTVNLFGDFRFWTWKFAAFHSRAFYDSLALSYPAPALAAYKLFLIPQPHRAFGATLRFLAAILIAAGIMLVGFRRGLLRRGVSARPATLFVVGVGLFSFPLWFEVHQANIEFVVWVLMTVAVWALWTERPSTAAICIGVAASMKIFPFVFVGVFLVRRQYRALVTTLVAAAVSMVVSLWLVCPDITYGYRKMASAVGDFEHSRILTPVPMNSGFDHSLFALLKRLLPSLPSPEQMVHFLHAYLAVVAIAGCFVFFARMRKLPFANLILGLSIAAVLLPPASDDYTLLHLYPAFALLTFVALEQARVATLRTNH